MLRITRMIGGLVLAMALTSLGGGTADAQTTMPAGGEGMDPGRGMAEVALSGGKVSIDYGRPEMKGRDMLAMAPAGFVWRFGSNKSTTFASDADLMFGDQTLAKGSYSAWIKHVEGDSWSLIFNSEVGIWGAPGASRENDVLEVPLSYSTGDESVERLTVELKDSDGKGRLSVSWGTHRLKGSFAAK
ncbi:MAG: DUF2911 domain-containing protein [Gemmatimonadetes bacterium]|nr:DUF2911 domain-containing protein [Gemmatimonadota bacterium]MYD24681.1 DUF2911 domain-containing protein [Gemmatimonadota bacterium]MYI99477.1 DUF2911 domain-containing protein [Gemmatimonadota bacterium]